LQPEDPHDPDSPSYVEVLATKYTQNNFRWVPLVREESGHCCSLSILYLRNGARGLTLSEADIDNRIKTIVDALKLPTLTEMPAKSTPGPDQNPFFVLLEADNLVTHLSVETGLLLDVTDPKLGDIDSRVVVSVKTWPY
jgi:hypothetical protein